MHEDKHHLVDTTIENTINDNMDVAFRGNGYTRHTDTTRTNHQPSYGNSCATQSNSSCKILQRKLELKVERARKNFRSQSDDGDAANVS